MAASNTNPGAGAPSDPPARLLSAAALQDRLEEEVSRAERQGSELACMLVMIENLEELAASHGQQLRGQLPRYLAGALESELRRFDAIGLAGEDELLVVLPGADSTRAEVVARRALERVRAIKIEVQGARTPLHTAVGLAAWQDGMSAGEVLDSARAAVRASSAGTANGDTSF